MIGLFFIGVVVSIIILAILYTRGNMIETDAAYIAGLFDGEGSIHFKRGIEKKKET